MANISLLQKQVRVHEQLSEALRQENLKEIELEITFFLFAKLSKSHKDDTTYRLNMAELENLTGHSYNLSEYIKAAKRLRNITFTVDREKGVLVTGLLHEADFLKGKGTVEVLVSKKLKPYLIDLTKNYTKHQLFSMLRLKSKHSKIIYMYLCQYRPKKGYVRQTIESKDLKKLKEKLGYINQETGEEKYKKYGEFNREVLKVAKKEINGLTDIKFSYTPVKWGREVVALTIDIENKSNEELISSKLEDFTQITDKNKSLEENLKELSDFEKLTTIYELTEHQAKEVMRKLDRKMLFDTLQRVDEAKKNNKIKKSVGGFSVQTIKNQFGNDII
jgi:plasmid replication initiation protein